MREFLIISVVGKNSLHDQWLRGDKTFDIALIHYDDYPIVVNTDIKMFLKKKGEKYCLIKYFIKENIELIKKYSYVWLPDNDIKISVDDVNKLFDISKKNDLYLSQPSMSGYYSHDITLRQTLGIRYTNFVEVLAPLFKTDILLQLYQTFDENESSWGLDYLWPFLLNYPNNKIAVLDQINMEHTKEVGINYDRFKKPPWVDFDELLFKYNLERDLTDNNNQFKLKYK